MKRQSIYQEILNFNVEEIWNIVINQEETSWRSDLIRTEILSEHTFKEYSVLGAKTTFKITKIMENQYYAFDMESSFFKGYWYGEFIQLGDQSTKIIFFEKIYFRNPLVYLMSFFKLHLKEIQKKYVEDLKKSLTNQKKELK
ncbi:hypothetical protein [Vagococcus hydrophili]|uniref:Polyketide cyclase n=1 Tax=Vagococcus hydrophili TaxID=2714947 RepID=A0A6G8ARC9_9ENTE|nr:hypothetical protein [Vagococcus hydrophili]QIL47638.1 hypothetical protein G7082_03340 [Vagococcus hydrophili]